jgi:hypothetical protein
MELLDMFGWMVLGFVPTLEALEMASRRLGPMRSRMVVGGLTKK